MIGKRMIGDLGEKFLEIGENAAQQMKKQVIKGIPQAAKTQLVGDKSGQGKTVDEKQKSLGTQKLTEDSDKETAIGKQYFAQMLGPMKKMTLQQMAQAKKQDFAVSQQKVAQIRQHLQRYNQIQQPLQVLRAKQAQEIPAYIRGKPGQAATPKEQAEKMAKLKKEEEEAKKQEKKKTLLPTSVSQLFGTREKGRFVIG